MLPIQLEILCVSDELSDNNLEVSEPIGRKLFAFLSLEISRNPFWNKKHFCCSK